ncbi:hypothetical protein [Arthrobacter sp. YN]|uniref:hypothetical protein n=1 Tax=Arthrobacter sp. YN TaxID=2020486 RepID=UPI001E2E1C1A|nr:hypothetical protein [Arthrobacter sp. YN]
MDPAVAAPHLSEPAIPELYSPHRIFTWNELQSMAFDGILLPLYGKSYASPGTAITHRLRARAAALTVPERIRTKVVAGRLTAAWIYGCANPRSACHSWLMRSTAFQVCAEAPPAASTKCGWVRWT